MKAAPLRISTGGTSEKKKKRKKEKMGKRKGIDAATVVAVPSSFHIEVGGKSEKNRARCVSVRNTTGFVRFPAGFSAPDLTRKCDKEFSC